jgi:hypothetical protein
LFTVLTSAQMLEGDVAGEREDRRAAEGFVAPADARSFLELARRGESLDTRDPITKAHFRALVGAAKPAQPAEGAPTVSGRQLIAAAQQRDDQTGVEGLQLTAPEQPVLLLQVALLELRLQAPERFSRRIEELGYLANVLVAGSRGRRPRPVEALEQAIAVCNTGLERALGADRALARAVELLEETPADQLFRRGYRG